MSRHVLLISRSFPHHRTGGMEWHVQDVAEGLMEAGWRVSVLTTPLPEEPALAPLEVNGEILTAGRYPARYSPGFFFSFWGKTGKSIRQLRPDLIHAQGFAGVPAWYAFHKEFPVLTTVHGTLWSETPLFRDSGTAPMPWTRRSATHWRYRHRYAFQPVWKSFLRDRAPLITDSRFTARALKREAHGRMNCLTVVPLGFNMGRFPVGDRDAARQEFGAAPGDILLAAVGRLEPVKRPDMILDSFLEIAAQHPRARLVIAGEGKLLAQLRERAAQSPHAERISLPGKLSPDQVPRLLHAADIFLNPDHGAPAFGLANAEALTMGTPVLATDAGAHREVVRPPEDGLLVPRNDATLWTAALEQFLKHAPESPHLRRKRAAISRRRFDRSRMIKRLVVVYERLLQPTDA